MRKAAIVERAVRRAREEYAAAGTDFATDFTRQDAAVMNIQRACEAAVDMANHIVRRDHLGVVGSARESFDALAAAGRITPELAESMRHMVGFRNLAVHDDQRLLLIVAERVIQRDLDDLLAFSEGVVRRA